MRIPYVDEIFPEARYIYVIRDPLANLSSAYQKWQTYGLNRRVIYRRLRETPTLQLPYYLPRLCWHLFEKRVRKADFIPSYGVKYPGFRHDAKTHSVEEVIAKQWVACCRQADEDIAKLDGERVLKVRYEDLVNRPREWIIKILHHCGLEMRQEIEACVPKIDAGRQDKWTNMKPEVLRRAIPILGPEMQRQGYEVPSCFD
jgi:hypothetical protein